MIVSGVFQDGMFKNLLNPPSVTDYSDYFKTLLTLSGVLLGLAFTALIFVIQNGFASFKFSRRMFLEQYVVFGRNLLSTLSYLTLIPLGELYFVANRKFLSGIYYIFAVIFTTIGVSFTDALFEVGSALTTNGISMGATNVLMPIGYKWLMIAAMTIGRVEILSILIALSTYKLKKSNEAGAGWFRRAKRDKRVEIFPQDSSE